jgi:hypothetical protein
LRFFFLDENSRAFLKTSIPFFEKAKFNPELEE